MDPTGSGIGSNRRYSVDTFITNALRRVLTGGLAEGVYEFTRVISTGRLLPYDPQAVIMTLVVRVFQE